MYRLCEVMSESNLAFCYRCVNRSQDLGANLTRPYKINERTVNQALELKHGKSVKTFNMDKVSNAAFDAVRSSSFSLISSDVAECRRSLIDFVKHVPRTKCDYLPNDS